MCGVVGSRQYCWEYIIMAECMLVKYPGGMKDIIALRELRVKNLEIATIKLRMGIIAQLVGQFAEILSAKNAPVIVSGMV